MPRKRYKPEEIVAKLRQVDVLVSQGIGVADAIRQIGVSEVDPPPANWSILKFGKEGQIWRRSVTSPRRSWVC